MSNIIEEGMCTNNTKPLRQYVKSRRQENIGVASLRDKSNLVSDNKSKAKLLIQQFQSVFTPEDNNPLPTMSNEQYL